MIQDMRIVVWGGRWASKLGDGENKLEKLKAKQVREIKILKGTENI